MSQQKSQQKTLAERIRDLDPRVTYIGLLIIVVGINFQPLGLPISMSPPTKSVYDVIEKLAVGDRVWYGFDSSIGLAEMWSPAIVTMKHLFSKQVKIMFVSFVADGPLIYSTFLPMALPAAKMEKKYGVDYVFMGFLPGDEIGVSALAGDLRGTLKTDYFGTPIDSIPLLDGVKTAKDFALVFGLEANPPVYNAYFRQIQSRFGVPTAMAVNAVNYPSMIPYYPQQAVGLMNGLLGAAEYEKLTGFLGGATATMDSFSVAQIFLVALVVICNIAYFGGKYRARSKGGVV